MATVAAAPTVAPESIETPGEMAVTLADIGWGGFEAIARLKGERRNPRLIYSDGSLTLVTHSYRHEHPEDRLDRIVMAVCSELDIPCNPAGSTFFKRQDLDRGIEGDRTYYLENERAIRGKDDIDALADPPPDLAIEVEITNPARQAVEVWRALGVPEVWVYRGRRQALTILHRDEHGRYVEAPASRSFPFLTAAEIRDWVVQARDEPESGWERRLRAWVRDELARRVGGPRP